MLRKLYRRRNTNYGNNYNMNEEKSYIFENDLAKYNVKYYYNQASITFSRKTYFEVDFYVLIIEVRKHVYRMYKNIIIKVA